MCLEADTSRIPRNYYDTQINNAMRTRVDTYIADKKRMYGATTTTTTTHAQSHAECIRCKANRCGGKRRTIERVDKVDREAVWKGVAQAYKFSIWDFIAW